MQKACSGQVTELRLEPRTACLQSLCSDHYVTLLSLSRFTHLSFHLAMRSGGGNVCVSSSALTLAASTEVGSEEVLRKCQPTKFNSKGTSSLDLSS